MEKTSTAKPSSPNLGITKAFVFLIGVAVMVPNNTGSEVGANVLAVLMISWPLHLCLPHFFATTNVYSIPAAAKTFRRNLGSQYHIVIRLSNPLT